MVWRDGVDNTLSILPFPLSLLRLSRNTKISDSREEVSAAATIKGCCKDCGFLWSSPFPGCCCTTGSLLFVVEGLDLKLDSCVWEDFLDGSLGVEVHGGGEAMGASLSSFAPFDPVELRKLTLGVGSSLSQVQRGCVPCIPMLS